MDANTKSRFIFKANLVTLSLVITVLASQKLTANSANPGLLSKNSYVTVLSLDGGGVRGIVSGTILSFLESKLQVHV